MILIDRIQIYAIIIWKSLMRHCFIGGCKCIFDNTSFFSFNLFLDFHRSWSSTSKILIPWVFLNFNHLMIHQPPKHIHYRISTIFQKQNDETTPDLMLRNKTKSDWPSLPFKKPKIKIKIAQNFTNTKPNETKRNQTDPLEIPNQPLQQIKTLPFSAFFLFFVSPSSSSSFYLSWLGCYWFSIQIFS